jgi:hypothetical protein
LPNVKQREQPLGLHGSCLEEEPARNVGEGGVHPVHNHVAQLCQFAAFILLSSFILFQSLKTYQLKSSLLIISKQAIFNYM